MSKALAAEGCIGVRSTERERAAEASEAYIAHSSRGSGLVGAGGGSIQGGSVPGLDDAHRVLVESGGGLALVRRLLAVADKRENRQGALAAVVLDGGILAQLQRLLGKLSIHVASVENKERRARLRQAGIVAVASATLTVAFVKSTLTAYGWL